MAESIKLTREELEKIITEELGELDEGMLDRMMAKLGGAGKGLTTRATNIAKKVGNKVVGALGGEGGWVEMDPRLQKELTILFKRFADTGKKGGKLDKIALDISNDFAKLTKNMDDKVRKTLEPVVLDAIGQFRSGYAALSGLGDAIQAQMKAGVKGSGEGTESERFAQAAAGAGQPAMAESRKRNRNIKVKILRANKR